MRGYIDYSEGKSLVPPKESPIEFATRIQRTYVAIHPFHEGCGRTSRLIQDLILNALGFPYLLNGDLQSDVTTPQQDYTELAREKLAAMNTTLKKCCPFGEQKGSENPDCRLLYDENSNGIVNKVKQTAIAQEMSQDLCDFVDNFAYLKKDLEKYSDLIVKGIKTTEPKYKGWMEPLEPLSPARIQYHESEADKYAFFNKLFESLAVPIGVGSRVIRAE